MALTSAKPLLLLLGDADASVRQFALKRLNAVVDELWYQTPSHLPRLEELIGSTDLEESRNLAALLCSRIYFHLGQYSDSIAFALQAGHLFTSMPRCPYADTTRSAIIDRYVANREAGEDSDPRVVAIFDHVASTWTADESSFLGSREIVGFTLRARREDLLDTVLSRHIAATKSSSLVSYTLYAAKQHIKDIVFRIAILRIVVKKFVDLGAIETDDYASIVDCCVLLHDAGALAAIMADLVRKERQPAALQIAFDVADSAGSDFVQQLVDGIHREFPRQAEASTASGAQASDAPPAALVKRVADIIDVLRGDVSRQLYLKFLYSQCKADIHILNRIKRGISSKVSVLQTATVLGGALMYSGTTIDGFYRDNIDWLAKAKDWGKFMTVASIGSLHRGHNEEAMNVLKPYLPNPANLGPLPFAEAGSLCALGLIHAGSSTGKGAREAQSYIFDHLKNLGTSNSVILHGAALGLGLSGLASRNEDYVDQLILSLANADATAGEAVALAVGLIMQGTAHRTTADALLAHARELNQKEKVIRGLSMAVALIFMGKEAIADPVIQSMAADLDPWLRVGATWVTGLAYAGTGNPQAIEKLLDVAVRDVNDDVRRNAIQQIGFVTLKDVDRCVSMTRTFSDSYNPHIRYGVAMALAIAGSGSANVKAVEILWTMKDDVSDFVRQGAIIGLSILLTQHTTASCDRVAEFRTMIQAKPTDIKVDTCTKFGCILANGLLDAGGRNATFSLHQGGHVSTKAVIGAFLFSQYWFWFPYALMASLALKPSCVIALNERLAMPAFSFVSKAAPSKYSPPASVLVEKKEAKNQGPKLAVLSTTAKENEYRVMKRNKSSAGVDLEVSVSTPTGAAAPGTDLAAAAKAAEDGTAAPAKAPEEPTEELLKNPARVTNPQLNVVAFGESTRYRPLRSKPNLGICLLVDRQPDEPEELVTVDVRDRTDIVKPPAPFDWP